MSNFEEVHLAMLVLFRDDEMWPEEAGTFERYCIEKWDLSPTEARKLALSPRLDASSRRVLLKVWDNMSAESRRSMLEISTGRAQ